jgi:hypothetical protein
MLWKENLTHFNRSLVKAQNQSVEVASIIFDDNQYNHERGEVKLTSKHPSKLPQNDSQIFPWSYAILSQKCSKLSEMEVWRRRVYAYGVVQWPVINWNEKLGVANGVFQSFGKQVSYAPFCRLLNDVGFLLWMSRRVTKSEAQVKLEFQTIATDEKTFIRRYADILRGYGGRRSGDRARFGDN